MRGRFVPSPDTSKTRPTASRTREALFNILQDVENVRMLDLFAGTGIMGIEAISRGAVSVTAVEMNKVQAKLIQQAYSSLKLDSQVNLLVANVLELSKDVLCKGGLFHLIYADPPFKDMDYPDLRPFWDWLNPGGVAAFEAPSKKLPQWAKDAEAEGKIQIRKYGESSLLIYRKPR